MALKGKQVVLTDENNESFFPVSSSDIIRRPESNFSVEETLKRKTGFTEYNDEYIESELPGVEEQAYESAKEIEAARGGKETLKERLDDISIIKDTHDVTFNKTLVRLANGDYDIDTITNSNIEKLFGDGYNSITGKSITWRNKNSVIIKNINFKNMTGLYFYDCGDILIENCTFENMSTVGVWSSNFNSVKIRKCSFKNIGFSCTGNDLNYLGGALCCNTGVFIEFSDNDVETIYGQGGVQPVTVHEMHINKNVFNDCHYRAVSINGKNSISVGTICYNNISNCGINNPTNSGVGCNGIYASSKTDLVISYNTIRDVVENGIEVNCKEVSHNTIINTGLQQDTHPTPSTEGIWVSCTRCINNTIENPHRSAIVLTSTDSAVKNKQIIGNTCIKGINSTTEHAIAFYSKGISDVVIGGNTSIGFDNVLFVSATYTETPARSIFSNNINVGGNLLFPGGHYHNLKCGGVELLNDPHIYRESLSFNDLKNINSSFVSQNNDGVVFKTSNQYDAFLYKEIKPKYTNSIIEIECECNMENGFLIKIVPFINGEYNYSSASVTTFTDAGVLAKGFHGRVINNSIEKYRVEIVDRTRVANKEFLIKYFSIKESSNSF